MAIPDYQKIMLPEIKLNDAIKSILKYSESITELRSEPTNVFRSHRYTGDLGEWYVAQLFNGIRAEKVTEKNWDVILQNGQLLEVKTQTYEKGNKWNYINKDMNKFDRFILVILCNNVHIRNLYDVPSSKLGLLLKEVNEKDGKKYTYKWKDLEDYHVNDINTLPGYEALKPLIKIQPI